MISRRRRNSCSVPLALSWSHAGAVYRLTPWPDVQLERAYGLDWVPVPLPHASAAEAALACGNRAWRSYLEFVPAEARDFALCFEGGRVAALQVAARCPDLLATLAETPTLTSFIAAHGALRGDESPRWAELSAQHERGGLFAVMEWLGLCASRQSLAFLQRLAAGDVPARLLAPLRALLWDQETVSALEQLQPSSARDLMRMRHALAA